MIEELRRFILVAENGNLTQTAKNIFVTQSTLSQSIDRLEKELGTKLFSHQGKSLQITPEGKSVLLLGTKIIELWENAKNANLKQVIKPVYTIGMFDNAALRLGKYFQNNLQHDSLGLELVIGASSKILSELQLGILDIGICILNNKLNLNKNILLIKTFSEDLIPVSSKKFKEKINDIPFILYNNGSFTRDYINEQFIKKSVTPKIFAESTSVTFMKELAILGCGVALLPKNSIQIELKRGILKKQKLPIKWKRDFGIYITKNGRVKKEDHMLKEIIKNLID